VFVASTPTALKVEVLTEPEWRRLRDVRLIALKDEPLAFLATYEREETYDADRWRQEFSRGEWDVMLADGRAIGLLGVTRVPGMPSQECYLEYLWVAPECRNSGMASTLLRTVLNRLRDAGVHTVWLYILDGNDRAMGLYQKFGFQNTGKPQPLPDDPRRSEQLMRLALR
jgi:ribosomal protein S18 acetylase RimI-like enzyme